MNKNLNFLNTPKQWSEHKGQKVAYECGLCFEDTTGFIGQDGDGDWVISSSKKSLKDPVYLEEGVCVWTLTS